MKGITLSQFVEIADRLYPFDQAEPWDNCGVQIGDPGRLITAAAFSLDATPRTVDYAFRHSCNLLVTHHPLLLEPVRTISADTLTGRTVLDAARLGVDILSLHTNLDACRGGLNDHLASVLGLMEVMVPDHATCARTGFLPSAVSVAQFARKVAADFGISDVRIVSGAEEPVRKGFCASGSGMGYFREAVRSGADVILTGDVRYHAAREAYELGIPVIDAGHYGLEKAAISLMAAGFRRELERLGSQTDCLECDLEEQPFLTLRETAGG